MSSMNTGHVLHLFDLFFLARRAAEEPRAKPRGFRTLALRAARSMAMAAARVPRRRQLSDETISEDK